MAEIVVKSIRKGWAGDIRRNRVVYTVASATTDSCVPATVGLHRIYSIQPTGRIGSWDGQTLVAAGHVTLNATNSIIIGYAAAGGAALSTGDVEADFYGI